MDLDLQPLLDWAGVHWPWAAPLLSLGVWLLKRWLTAKVPDIRFVAAAGPSPQAERVAEAALAVGAQPIMPQYRPNADPRGPVQPKPQIMPPGLGGDKPAA